MGSFAIDQLSLSATLWGVSRNLRSFECATNEVAHQYRGSGDKVKMENRKTHTPTVYVIDGDSNGCSQTAVRALKLEVVELDSAECFLDTYDGGPAVEGASFI